jgi:hypothetical protein
MEDLAAIAMVMFVAWIAAGIALVALAWLAPARWSPILRVTLMLLVAAFFVFLTVVLFGGGPTAVAAAVSATLVVFLGARRG